MNFPWRKWKGGELEGDQCGSADDDLYLFPPPFFKMEANLIFLNQRRPDLIFFKWKKTSVKENGLKK
jgi:hypothetical protein